MPDPILRRLTPRRVLRSARRRAAARLGPPATEPSPVAAQLSALAAEVAGLRQAQAETTARMDAWETASNESIQALTTRMDTRIDARIDTIEEQVGRLQRSLDDIYDSVVVQNAAARAQRRADLGAAGPGEES